VTRQSNDVQLVAPLPDRMDENLETADVNPDKCRPGCRLRAVFPDDMDSPGTRFHRVKQGFTG
jgi:hypothetical protein